MKINKLVLIFLLSFSSIFCSSSICSADTNTPVDYTQYKFDTIPSPINATGTITLESYLAKNTGVLKSVNTNINEYSWPYLLPQVLDQGSSSECCAFATKAIKDMLDYSDENSDQEHSSSFIYGFRIPGSYTGEGMYEIQVLDGLHQNGVCLNESLSDLGTYPELNSKITPSMIEEAKGHKIDNYIRLYTEQEIKTGLMNISPVLISIPCYSSFCQGGILHLPDTRNEYYLGGHALCITGFKQVAGVNYWIILNSWGQNWGDMNGYCLMPFDYPIYEYWCIDNSDETLSLTPSSIKTTFSNQNPTPNESITYSSIATYLYPNQTTSNIVTRDITNYPDLTITTSNPDLISIDKTKNTINTLKTGKASIIFTYKGSGQEYIINITEIPPDPPIPPTPDPTPNQKIKSLTILQSSNINKIFTNSSLNLQAIADKNYKTKSDITSNVELISSNNKIATIDSDGNLTATSNNKEGKVKITAKYTYQSNNKSYTKSDYMYIYIVNTDKYYTINILKSKDKLIIDKLSEELTDKYLGFDISVIKNGSYYELMVGKFADNSDEIKGLYKKLKGMGYRSSRIVYINK